MCTLMCISQSFLYLRKVRTAKIQAIILIFHLAPFSQLPVCNLLVFFPRLMQYQHSFPSLSYHWPYPSPFCPSPYHLFWVLLLVYCIPSTCIAVIRGGQNRVIQELGTRNLKSSGTRIPEV